MTKTNYFLFVLCFVLLVIKIISIYLTDFDLFGDEAQYWLWSQNPDFGYFSKPPLLPWIIALVCSIFGNSLFVIKMIPTFIYCVNSYIVFLITKKLYSNLDLAFLTAAAFFLMPAVSFSSFLVSTDILLIFFWSLALLQILIIKENQNIINFILLGAFVGLAFLTKYAAIYFIFSMLFLLFEKKMRNVFFKNKLSLLYLVLTFIVVIAPNIVWNINNNWITFEHAADNAALNRMGFNFVESIKFIGSQILMVGPLIFLFFIFGFVKNLINDFNTRFLLIFSLPVFIIILIESILVRANANWAAVSLISFLILFVHTTFMFSKKLIFINNIANFIFGLCFFFFIGISASYGPFKRISGISSFADFLISHHNLEHINKLVISDRMLFSNLRYIFYNSEIQMYVPFAPNKQWGHHFQITNPLPADFNNNFIFLGYVDQLSYLNNKHIINLVDITTVPFNKNPIKIYEVIF
jgi:4-amino-4-deoxy-L-arabinose transferase-like glycosyltransferase|tara:strand:- start:12891 stop:14291 length:1401 start_codon:yes stop_codon:yes gene_type:complete